MQLVASYDKKACRSFYRFGGTLARERERKKERWLASGWWSFIAPGVCWRWRRPGLWCCDCWSRPQIEDEFCDGVEYKWPAFRSDGDSLWCNSFESSSSSPSPSSSSSAAICVCRRCEGPLACGVWNSLSSGCGLQFSAIVLTSCLDGDCCSQLTAHAIAEVSSLLSSLDI